MLNELKPYADLYLNLSFICGRMNFEDENSAKMYLDIFDCAILLTTKWQPPNIVINKQKLYLRILVYAHRKFLTKN